MRRSTVTKALLNQKFDEYRNGESRPSQATIGFLLEAIAKIGFDPPFVCIENLSELIEELESCPVWIAYGGPRTGSTFVFLALKAMMDSAKGNGLYCWEGDFSAPEKFFDMIEASDNSRSGVLKIHRRDESAEKRIRAGLAKAFLSVRDYPSIAKSYWRMKHNSHSPFYTPNPSLAEIESLIKRDIEAELVKRNLPNTTIIRESAMQPEPLPAIIEIAKAIGAEVNWQSFAELSRFLSKKSLALRSQRASLNSTGHDKTTFLHVNHISSSESFQEGMAEIANMVTNKFGKLLDQQGYLIGGQCAVSDVSG